ncbi:MAG TPA: DinB family protein [Thermoanaerobaculia bacterium]
MIDKPSASEYAPFYAGYISKAPAGDVVELLDRQKDLVRRLSAATPAEQETFRYAAGKWSVREVAGHMTDAERVFGYRAFRIARGDETPLEGFDENEFVANSTFHERSLSSLIDELVLVRDANLAIFCGLSSEEWMRKGTANGSPVSVRALAFILVGHMHHHMDILRDRYGLKIDPK